MAITLELHGLTNNSWPLSSNCIRQIEILRESEVRALVTVLFGDDSVEAGTIRTVSRAILLDSVKKLLKAAKQRIPGGFQIRVPPLVDGMESSIGQGSISGLRIDGFYHRIMCIDDYWTLQSIDDLRDGRIANPRYLAEEIPTENLGAFRVEQRKSDRSELSILLISVERYLSNDKSDNIQIIWG